MSASTGDGVAAALATELELSLDHQGDPAGSVNASITLASLPVKVPVTDKDNTSKLSTRLVIGSVDQQDILVTSFTAGLLLVPDRVDFELRGAGSSGSFSFRIVNRRDMTVELMGVSCPEGHGWSTLREATPPTRPTVPPGDEAIVTPEIDFDGENLGGPPNCGENKDNRDRIELTCKDKGPARRSYARSRSSTP